METTTTTTQSVNTEREEAAAASEAAVAAGPSAGDAVVAFLERIINRRPEAHEISPPVSEVSRKKMETFVAIRREGGNYIAQEMTMGAVMESLDLSGITTSADPSLLFSRNFAMPFCEGRRNTVNASIWARDNSSLTLVFLVDYVPWNGVFLPYYNEASDSIWFRQCTDRGALERHQLNYNRHYTEEACANFRCVIPAKAFDLDKILLVMEAQKDAVGHVIAASYYMYGVVIKGKDKCLKKLPFNNIFDDGRLCCKATQGMKDVSVLPHRLFDDLENSPGNFDLARSENTRVVGEVNAPPPPAGVIDYPYIWLRLEAGDPLATLNAQIPPIWRLVQ
jgi:hypothetical protein